MPNPGAEVAPGVFRLGANVVNYYVLEQDGQLTVVDAGGARHFKQLRGFLESRGWSLDAIAAVLLTHAHSDHVGFAEQARTEADVPVHIHQADEVIATGGDDDRSNEAGVASYLKHRAAWKTILSLLRAGGTKIVPVAEVSTFDDGEVLDVPGRPRVVHTPGHTRGSASLHVPGRELVFTGDALVTWNVMTGRHGPQIMPAAFNESSEQALASLSRLQDLDAAVVLPGHGPHFNGGAEAAVLQARAAGKS